MTTAATAWQRKWWNRVDANGFQCFEDAVFFLFTGDHDERRTVPGASRKSRMG
jgi:hypothetical protein